MKQPAILKLNFSHDLYDDMTDSLLAFPGGELDFMAYSVQAHGRKLENISEQVSGFKQKMVIEINTEQNQAEQIYHHLKESMSSASFNYQLYPLIALDVSQ